MEIVGKECFYVDKVTFGKEYDGKALGVCKSIGIHSSNQLPIAWFDEPFLGFKWQYIIDITTDINQDKLTRYKLYLDLKKEFE